MQSAQAVAEGREHAAGAAGGADACVDARELLKHSQEKGEPAGLRSCRGYIRLQELRHRAKVSGVRGGVEPATVTAEAWPTSMALSSAGRFWGSGMTEVEGTGVVQGLPHDRLCKMRAMPDGA